MDRSAVLCTQHSPADWHGRLGGVQTDTMIDRLAPGAVRIGLGDVNVRKLLVEKKYRYAPAKRVIWKRLGHRHGSRETCGAEKVLINVFQENADLSPTGDYRRIAKIALRFLYFRYGSISKFSSLHIRRY